MGIFGQGKDKKMKNLTQKYIKDRVKEKREYDNQLRKIDAQLSSKLIDVSTYERFRGILEVNFVKKREEARWQFAFSIADPLRPYK